MKLLFATHIFPYPPMDGGRIGFYNPIKYLSRRHEIILMSLVGPDEQANIEAMRPRCADILTMQPGSSGDWRRYMRGIFSSPPGTASKYFIEPFAELLQAAVHRHRPDIVELQHLNMAAYLPYCGAVPVILREHNAEFRVWERFAEQQENWASRLFFRRLAGRVKRYEARQVERAALCVAVSEADESALRRIAPRSRVVTIPSGVDCEYFVPVAEPEVEYSMVMTGSFFWKPKQANLLKLATRIFPRIKARLPQATLTIVGQGMPEALRRTVEVQGVTVTGAVPDVRPYVRRAALVLNYLEAGGGIALKVLEAMAMRKPVLSNGPGIEGIPLITPGRHAAVADGEESYATAAVQLLSDAAPRASIATAGYKLIKRHYSWEVLAESFDRVYQEVATGVGPQQSSS